MAKRRTPYLEANDSPAEKFWERREASKFSTRQAAKSKDPVTKSMHKSFAKHHKDESEAALGAFRNSIRGALKRKGTR